MCLSLIFEHLIVSSEASAADVINTLSFSVDVKADDFPWKGR